MMGVILASFSSYGSIGQVLSFWEQSGFFSYVLPFLLVFALVFVILGQIHFFKDNRTINAVIALVVALLALQSPFVSDFFSKIFPQVGIGLAIILAILILIGLFFDPGSKVMKFFFVIVGVIITIVVLVRTFGVGSLSSAGFLVQKWPEILGIVIVLTIIGIIVAAGRPTRGKLEFPELNPIAWAPKNGGR